MQSASAAAAITSTGSNAVLGHTAVEPVVHDAGCGDEARRRQRVHRDPVGVHLGGETGREPFERGLAHAVHRAPAHAPLVRWSLRVAGRAGGDVEDPAPLRRAHAGKNQPRELERRPNLHLEHQRVVRVGERVDGLEVGDGGVVDEHVDRAQPLLDGVNERVPILRTSEVGRDRDRASPAASIDSTVLVRLPGSGWSPSLTVRADTATAAPSAANNEAIASPMPRLAPVTSATRPSSFTGRAAAVAWPREDLRAVLVHRAQRQLDRRVAVDVDDRVDRAVSS